MRGLVEELEAYADATGDEVTVVFDGRPWRLPDLKQVDARFAPTRRRDAADDEIVRIVAGDPDPSTLRVVTSDSGLAARVRSRGAEVEPVGRFRRRLDGLESAG
jgi:predicted RNA-binding protein with PIN domain